MANAKYTPGQHVDAWLNGFWLPAVVTKIAQYAGKSGAGYYIAFDPPNPNCVEAWKNDNMLRPRAAIAKATGAA